MTKYTRVTGKVFGASADPTGTVDPTIGPTIGQFGSALDGQYIGTSDISTIQSLPAWSSGFIGCVTPNTQFPPLPEMTGFGKVLSQQICYLLQQGVPEYDSGTTYYTGNWCSYNNSLYIAKVDGFSNVAPTDTTKWDKFTGGFSRNYGEIVTSSLPITDATLHLADGSLLNNTDYPEFVSYVANLYNSSTITSEFTQASQNLNLSTFENWTGIAYGNGKYIAVNSTGYYSASNDGIAWSSPVNSNIDYKNGVLDIIFDGSYFIIACGGSNSVSFYKSEDGETWVSAGSFTSTYLSSVSHFTYNKGVYIIVSYNGKVYRTINSDLTSWSEINDLSTSLGSEFFIQYINDLLIISGTSGGSGSNFYVSEDNGTNFTEVTSATFTGSPYIGIYYEKNKYYLINHEGYISYTTDFNSFSTPVQNTYLGNHYWWGITFDNSDKITLLSPNGYISQKTIPLLDIFTTEANWQSSYLTYGECGKYVYDSVNNTVRIPLYNSYLTNTTNPQKLGNLTPASLPNIKGSVRHLVLQDGSTDYTWDGAFYNAEIGGTSYRPTNITSAGSNKDNIGLDASRSSSVYSDTATTVNTQSIKQLVYIVVGK